MLTPNQLQSYKDNGFVIVNNLYDSLKQKQIVDHMLALHKGTKAVEGFKVREKDDWGRTMNTHTFDEVIMSFLLDDCLRKPLEQMCDDQVDAIQTMYFYKGSQQRRHQDQYYLPDCFSAWTAFDEVTKDNGCLWVQPGSHKKELLDKKYFKDKYGEDIPLFGDHYDSEVDELFERNGFEEVPVLMQPGDTLFFHGRLIHRGGPIADENLFRHSLANHYIPYGSGNWDKKGWLRYSFDGDVRDTAATV